MLQTFAQRDIERSGVTRSTMGCNRGYCAGGLPAPQEPPMRLARPELPLRMRCRFSKQVCADTICSGAADSHPVPLRYTLGAPTNLGAKIKCHQ